MAYPTTEQQVPQVLARWEKARYLKTTDGYFNTDLDTLTHYAHAHEDIRVLARRIVALEAERDTLRAAARLVLDRCTGQDFDRAAIAEALNVLAACLPDDALLGPRQPIEFTEDYTDENHTP